MWILLNPGTVFGFVPVPAGAFASPATVYFLPRSCYAVTKLCLLAADYQMWNSNHLVNIASYCVITIKENYRIFMIYVFSC